MEQYIDKSALVAEITHKIKVLEAFVNNFDGISDKVEKAKNKIEALGDALLFIGTLEVKEVMPALDNGKMPIERWKEAVKAASNQANYRKSQGLTETCDDYFVDGVQWGDENPIVTKEVDLYNNGWIDCTKQMPPETKQTSDTRQGHREWTESDRVLVWDSMYGCSVDATKNGKWMSEQRGGYTGQIVHGIIAWRPIPEFSEELLIKTQK